MWGLAETLLWSQLVAEGSSSTWRAFGVAMAKVRRVNAEGSACQLNQRNDWLSLSLRFSSSEGERQYKSIQVKKM